MKRARADRNKRVGQQGSARTINEIIAAREEKRRQKLLVWRRRPRIHFSQLEKPECVAKLAQILGSDERLAAFKDLLTEYGAKPSLESYLQLRLDFPEVEIDVATFSESLIKLKPELAKCGIDTGLFAGTLDAYEPAIDELSLQLMKCLVARSKLPNSGPGHLEKRREAISDASVDYLIAMMLEAMGSNNHSVVIPPSLVVLIRDRLCRSAPRLYEAYHAKQQRGRALYVYVTASASGKPPSLRKFASLMGVSKGTAARWLDHPGFQHAIRLAESEGWANVFQNLYAARRSFEIRS
jgi:hypothetical protein